VVFLIVGCAVLILIITLIKLFDNEIRPSYLAKLCIDIITILSLISIIIGITILLIT